MTSQLDSLEPRSLWQHFDAIRKIPRPSKHEERIVQHIEAWANDRGFELKRDAVGNMVIRVPATSGLESAPAVLLQGHLDMVCEKNADVTKDFMSDPIDAYVDGDWVKAHGTTLGADNGVGVASALALVDDPDVQHGPLELLFTLDEETGLTGAAELDASLISARIMVNTDTEEDGAIYIGCAGGADSIATFPLARRRALIGTVPIAISVRGLRGGHSGLDIIENRGNAIKLAVRTLMRLLRDNVDFDIAALDGGSKHNAIPREADAVLRVDPGEVERVRAIVSQAAEAFTEELQSVDPGLKLTVEQLEDSADHQRVMNVHARDRLLRALDGIPHGVHAMSRDVPGLVETSSNLAVVQCEAGSLHLTTSHRSSVMPALLAAQGSVRSICELGGADVEAHDAYPGWQPNPDSPLLQRSIRVYRELFSSEPATKAIHAGLECGLLLDKVPGMDIISIGPEITGAHSPDESVQISSVQRYWKLLAGVLGDIARNP
jgi:dipeptidase D